MEEDEKKEEESDQSSSQSSEKIKKEKAKPSPAVLVNKDWKTEVISAQQFDGCWDEKAIMKILGNAAKKALEEKPYPDVTIWCSALALAILELKCMDAKTSWEVVSNKGRAFMAKKLAPIEQKDKDEIFKIVMSLINKAKDLLITLI